MSWCYYIWKEALVLTQGLAFKYKFTSFFLLFHSQLSSNSYLVKKTGSSWRLQALKYANGSWECWRSTWNLCVQSICKYASMSPNVHGGRRRKWVLYSITFGLIPLQQSLTETGASPAASNPPVIFFSAPQLWCCRHFPPLNHLPSLQRWMFSRLYNHYFSSVLSASFSLLDQSETH